MGWRKGPFQGWFWFSSHTLRRFVHFIFLIVKSLITHNVYAKSRVSKRISNGVNGFTPAKMSLSVTQSSRSSYDLLNWKSLSGQRLKIFKTPKKKQSSCRSLIFKCHCQWFQCRTSSASWHLSDKTWCKNSLDFFFLWAERLKAEENSPLSTQKRWQNLTEW